MKERKQRRKIPLTNGVISSFAHMRGFIAKSMHMRTWFSTLKIKDTLSFLIMIFLAVVALILGIAILRKSPIEFSFLKSQNTLQPEKSDFLQTQNMSNVKLIPSSYSQQERALLNVPPPNATDEQKAKHIELARMLAKESDTLKISSCKPTPLVLKIKKGSNFKLINKDTIDHTIIIDPEHEYQVAAQAETTITAEFGKPPGLYGYVCEGVGLVGFIIVEP